ncbi:MAG: PilW family protein [Oleiphilus sp.]
MVLHKQLVKIRLIRQRGLTLIELMITMSVSLFFMLSVYKVFDIHQHGVELLVALHDREDNAQLAMKVLEDNIRMADHWGGVESPQVTVLAPFLAAYPGDCGVAWVFNTEQGIYGLDGESSSAQVTGLPSKCIDNNDYAKEADFLALRFGDSQALFYSHELDNKRFQKHYFLRSQSGKSAVIFPGSKSSQALTLLPDEGQHYNMKFQSSLFFLRPCRPKVHVCDPGEKVLSRLDLKGNRYIQEALVEGVEHMQFEYGVDSNRDGNVDRYDSADAILDWQSVLSVRLYLLMRSRSKDSSRNEAGKVYVMNSNNNNLKNSYRVPENQGMFSRKLYVKEIALRNRQVH